MKTLKNFDCVKMKDEAQRRRAERLAGLSDERRLAFFREAHKSLLRRQKELRDRSGSSA